MARKQINIRAGFDLSHFSESHQNLIRGLKGTASQMKSIGKEMSMAITGPLVAMGGLAVKTFADFEQSMAKVQAVSGATGQQFKTLNQLAKDLGATTRFTATEVSELMLNYSKLGFSAGEIEKITGATLNLALATGEDLAKSAEVAGSTLRAFGLDADQMLRVTDVMAKSFSSSALDLDRFSESMKYVAPVAASAGISIEETSAMLAVLANSGVKGSQAGTSLRRIISDLGSTSGGTTKAIEKLAKQGLNLADAKDEVGRTAQSALLILSNGVNQIKPLTSEFENAAGSAEAMAGIMDDTLQGSMFKLKSAVEGVGISFGEMLAPAMGKVAGVLAELANGFTNLNPETKSVIITTLGLTAAIGPLIYAIGALSGALAFLAANPITAILIAIGAAVVALNIAAAQTNKIFGKVQITVDLMKESYKKLGDEIGEIDKLKKQGVKASQDEIKLRIASTRAVIAETYELVKQAYQKKKALLDEKKAQMDAVMAQTRSVGMQGEFQGADLAKVEQIQKNIDALNEEIKTSQTEIVNAANGTKDLEAQLQSLGDVSLAPVVDEVKAISTEIKQLGIDFSKGIAAANLQKPLLDSITKGIKSKDVSFIPIDLKANLSPEQLREELTKLEKSIYEPVMVPIDLKPIEITQELFDQQAIAAAKRQAADLGEEMGDALSSGLKALATEGLTQFGDFLGTVISGGDMTVKDFGKGLLDSLGKFMGQFGEAMIAMGIAQVMLDVAIKSFNPALAIIGGVALVAAGAAISNLSQKGMDTSGGSGGSSFSGSGGFSSMSGIGASMQPIVLDTRLSGRDMIITQGRESQFKR
jgi:phage-related minor tail protein